MLAEVFDNAVVAWGQLGLEPSPDAIGSLTLCTSIEDACAGAEFVVESVPERLDLKHATLLAIDAASDPSAVIASSTSGFRPSVLAEPLAHPQRLVVGHPFNPVYLLPLVEVVAGTRTDESMVARALDLYQRARHASTAGAGRDRRPHRRPPAGSRVA